MKYGPEIIEKICAFIVEDDYTIEELCTMAGISRETYNVWKNDKSDFSDAIKKANEQRLEVFKQAARKGLRTLLEGKEFEEVTTEYKEVKTTNEAGQVVYKPRMVSQKKVKKFIQPNPTSVIFALKNVDSDNFKDIIKQEHTGADGNPLLPPVIQMVSPKEHQFPSSENEVDA